MNLSVTRSSRESYWPKEFNGAPCANATGDRKTGWFIDIATVEDFHEFTKTNGELVFYVNSQTGKLTVEIYDDYRE